MARQLAARGWKLGLTARRRTEMDDLAASIRLQHPGAVIEVEPADALDVDATRLAVQNLASRLGPVDLLIANAGMARKVDANNLSTANLEEMIRVNLIGAVAAIEAVLPSMIERRAGQVVGISSLAAYRGLPGVAGYSASKAGLSTFLEGLRVELAPLGVVVTTVHPGYVITPMTAGQTNPRPFLMKADRAVGIMLRGILKGKSRVDFPAPMVGLLRIVRLLPNWVYDPLVRKLMFDRRSRDDQ